MSLRVEGQVFLDGHFSLPEELALLDDLLHLRLGQEAVLCVRRSVSTSVITPGDVQMHLNQLRVNRMIRVTSRGYTAR